MNKKSPELNKSADWLPNFKIYEYRKTFLKKALLEGVQSFNLSHFSFISLSLFLFISISLLFLFYSLNFFLSVCLSVCLTFFLSYFSFIFSFSLSLSLYCFYFLHSLSLSLSLALHILFHSDYMMTHLMHFTLILAIWPCPKVEAIESSYGILRTKK